MGLDLVLLVATVAFAPLHEYWCRQARSAEEQLERRHFGDQVMPFFVGAWALVLLYYALR